MESQGPNNPGTIANISAGAVAWSNVANVAASNNSYATVVLNFDDYSDLLRCTNFGFNIPLDAHIQGVLVEVERKASATSSIANAQTSLVLNATPIGYNFNFSYWTASDVVESLGSSTDYWFMGGGSLTPQEVNDSTFGFEIQVLNESLSSRTASIDHIKMTVYYQAATYLASPGTIAGVFNNSDTTWNTISNAGASDNAYAEANFQVAISTRTEELKCTNFGFSIPSHLYIRGIKVEIEHSSDTNGGVNDYKVQLYRNNVLQTNVNKASATAWPTSDAYASYGGEDDLWGLDDLSPSDINNINFGVMLQAQQAGGVFVLARVDHVRITVYTSQYPKGSLMLTGFGR